ncbi:type IV pilus twitching motility protein PilT [Paenibacillus lignilyticus]|uniref:Type IV pilus twitching motility protein PilT n=1 Tax=Paenibacillus lignilyticus TaxID=1172615 RepID=A0ABS5CLX3_9BACL|nr:type IV pilus twitching motility protein PilT [Paenibacillus lignilyticus]MBP3966845.1 type IV pilus twitching motility protein PilT [Paenibacillus lignilyticus]
MTQVLEQITSLLQQAHESKASDLHISVGSPPVMRVHGTLQRLGEEAVTIERSRAMATSLLNSEQLAHFEQAGEVDFSYELEGYSRYRINAYRQRGKVSIAIRTIPTRIPSLEQLQLPAIIETLANKHQGLVLVTGPTGSGKSSTLAAMIDYINRTQKKHIVTLEDPIEFLHTHSASVVDQREVGNDTKSFSNGLRAALRQDPDVILVGEMRDLETISAAVTAAETGHLVFATLHTTDAPQTIDRIIDAFPSHQQGQIRTQLAAVLLGVISQRLLPRPGGQGRSCATEIMINTPAVANLIRTEKIHQIKSVMQTGRALGMHTLDASIKELLQSGRVDPAAAKVYLTEGAY